MAVRVVKDKLAGLDRLASSQIAERLPQHLGIDI